MSDVSQSLGQSPIAASSSLPVLDSSESVPYEIQRRLRVLQRLRTFEGRPEYLEEKHRAGQELDVSPRSLRRLIRRYREQGLDGLIRRSRSDQGQSKVSLDWQRFIIEQYRKGNRGSQQMNCAQVANLVASRAAELGVSDYPSRRTVYRILSSELSMRTQKQQTRHIGWQGERLKLTTREGIELSIEYSNQVWQCDHTPADILVVDRHGEVLGRPHLSTVIDTHSRCIVGLHLGMEAPSAAVTCLALRHAISAKQYPSSYRLSNLWSTYGIPQYLYTDAGSDFTSRPIDQIAASLGITLCLRRRPSDGGIVERCFGTLNSEFFSTLPGYTGAHLADNRPQVETDARLTLEQLEQLLVRYIVDRYNQLPDPRIVNQSRIARWESDRIAQPNLPSERELDILLMRQDRRRIYHGGYIRFANLVYRGEYLAGYAGQSVVLRYDPRDITSILVYRQQGNRDQFLARAYAQHLDTDHLSLAEAKAISRRLRQHSRAITNQSVLAELRDRTQFVEDLLKSPPPVAPQPKSAPASSAIDLPEPPEPLPDIQVYDYEELRRGHSF